MNEPNNGDYFGESWGAPANAPPSKQIETPVGEECLLCNEPIEADHRGFFQTFFGDNVPGRYVHRECQLRTIMGSPLHQTGDEALCQCNGGPGTGKTYREEALEVWDIVTHGF